MKRSVLEGVLAAILNEADFDDLEVIKKAIERRFGDLNTIGRGNFNAGSQARNLAESVQGQVGASLDSLTKMTRNFVEDLIRQQAPDIPEGDLQKLLAEWVPNEAQKAQRAAKSPKKKLLPPDVLAVMIRDFIAYSTGSMSASKQILLKDEIGDWEKIYWESFPERIQKLIHVFLGGKIDMETFWGQIQETLEE